MRFEGPCLILLLLCLAQRPPLRAQTVFSSLYPRDGLSSKEVLCSFTDSEGFLWCGTATGLNRWDGSHFYVITPFSRTYPGLLSETVYAISEWGGKLWVGTKRGLSCLSRYEGRFRTVPFVRGQDTLQNLVVHRLLLTGNSPLMTAATSNGIFVFRGGCMRPLSSVVPGAGVLDSSGALIFPGSRGRFWARADSGLYLVDRAAGSCLSRRNNPGRWTLLTTTFITAMSEAPDGRVWFATYKPRKGLFCFDPATGRTEETPGFEKQVIHLLYHDHRDRLWISSTTPYATVLDHRSGKITQLAEGQLSYALFHHVQEDAAGNLWFATAAGLSKLAAVQPLESYITLPAMATHIGAYFSLVNQLQIADSGHIWVCKDDGLYRMSLADRSFRRFMRSAEREARENRIFDIHYLQGKWWCGTGTGIFFFDEKSGRFTPFTGYAKSQVPWKKSVMWLRSDRQGHIWYASWVDAIYRYDPATGQSIRIADSSYGDIGPGNCLFGLEDRYGRFWTSYAEKGVRCWNAAAQKMYNPVPAGPDREALADCIVYNMVEDERGGYWLATNKLGAVHLDSAARITQRISLQQGLYTTAALNVWVQPGGRRLWIATSEGIQTYEIGRRLLSAIDLDFGIMVQDYCSVLLGIGHRVYISVNGKLAVLNLDAADGAAAAPRPLLTGVRVFEHERPVPPPDSVLQLRYNENFFSIDFSSPLHHDVPVLQYAYLLEGYDKNWVYCGRRQSASYTNVAPGTYRFRIRSTNELGEWQRAESVMRITIRAPFWQQAWFVALAAALLLFGLFHLVRYGYRRRRRSRIDATIAYFARSTHGDNSVADICWDISRNCIAQMGLEDCVVYLRDVEKNVLLQVAAYGPKNPHDRVIENPIEIPVGKGIVGTVAATGKPILVSDTRKDPRYVIDDASRLSELAVPIVHDGFVIGVIDTEHSRKDFYKEAHLKALTTIASISSNKIAEAQAEESVRANERELLQIKSMLADSQLMALRTQMNPHFVFNCLNSIQECIVTGKYGEASHYLNKFSKLFRALLDNSGKPLIPLSEEIAVLELYLSLEHMRFEGSFDYGINVDDELETEEIMIPSMLLQPFVENALWHGLMHKEGERRLTLSFEAVPGDLFRCTIDDNGIGRERAGALKASRATGKSHISRGLQITTDRIALMQRRGQAAALRIIDKHNTAGKATGTTVIVELSAYLTTLEA